MSSITDYLSADRITLSSFPHLQKHQKSRLHLDVRVWTPNLKILLDQSVMWLWKVTNLWC